MDMPMLYMRRYGHNVSDPEGAQVTAKIARLRAEIADRFDEIHELQLQRSYPSVVPVLHYFRYHRQHTEYYEPIPEAYDLQQGAFRHLAQLADDHECSPDGVSVGGDFLPMATLVEMYGWPD